MRVNVYAEEMTDRIEIIEKTVDDGGTFTGLRIYLELPVSVPSDFFADRSVAESPYLSDTKDPTIKSLRNVSADRQAINLQGPFIHRPGDDDSSAVTFWGKRDLRMVLRKMLAMLDAHYADADKRYSEHEE